MAEAFAVQIPADALTNLSKLYDQAPEPTRGKTHEAGRYQIVVNSSGDSPRTGRYVLQVH